MRQSPRHSPIPRPAPPRVLVLAEAGAESGRIATLLGEAGIAVTPALDKHAALAALAAEEFDLAVVAAPLLGAVEAVATVKAVRRRRPGLEVLFVAEIVGERRRPEPARLDARRFIGRVRDRLACAEDPFAEAGDRRHAEFGIAAAKLACLYRRHETALDGGARAVARSLAREIDETAAQRDALRRQGFAPSPGEAVHQVVS